MKNKILFVLLLTMLSTGCATKHYGRMGDVTEYETKVMECNYIDMEIAKSEGFISRVEKESQFSAASVFSFLGDFGIGNMMEKRAALNSANDRLTMLRQVRATKCKA